jgi:hypothetical protein
MKQNFTVRVARRRGPETIAAISPILSPTPRTFERDLKLMGCRDRNIFGHLLEARWYFSRGLLREDSIATPSPTGLGRVVGRTLPPRSGSLSGFLEKIANWRAAISPPRSQRRRGWSMALGRLEQRARPSWGAFRSPPRFREPRNRALRDEMFKRREGRGGRTRLATVTRSARKNPRKPTADLSLKLRRKPNAVARYVLA